MATIRIPRLVGKTNKAGLTTWYWQPSATLRAKGWAPQRLGSSIGADIPEDVAAAARALNEKVDGAGALRPPELRRLQRPLTLDQAIKRWRDAGFPSVKRQAPPSSPATARQYRSKCRTLEAWGKALRSPRSPRARREAARRLDGSRRPPAAGKARSATTPRTKRCASAARCSAGSSSSAWSLGQQPVRSLRARGAGAARADMVAAGARGGAARRGGRQDPCLELAIDLAFSIGQREADLLRLQIGQYVEIPHYKWIPRYGSSSPRPTPTAAAASWAYGCARTRAALGRGADRRRHARRSRARSRPPRPPASRRCCSTRRAAALDAAQPRGRAAPVHPALSEIRQWAIDIARDGDRADPELAAELEQLQFRDFRRTAVVTRASSALPTT
jgi:hypothetical protein